ncbi:thioredoxin-related transmembrane protein 2-B isoform X2 [Lingula anatina]|nr:thioredoxin-related transmembrane protein 2-B isoform X2 [Lingula anatina]XP_013404669.1 thioredoxin-related transmembrane protein 2-B isoform X2 [Lingula anatina]|eukprot:XP_013404667.1 thioredoxin-related transmembrane protein 2-B isoform X2 [Lingula anatina]
MFLGCVIVLKNRKTHSIKDFIDVGCMFAKIASIIMFFRQNVLMAVGYGLLCLAHIAFLPKPMYSGPELITYFRANGLREELSKDKRVTWLVEFYAAWSPACVNFAPVFSELSAKYSLDNLKFGKLDVSRFTEEAKEYGVDNSSWSKQLPSLILFENGKEKMRRPHVDHAGRIYKFPFIMENVIKDFGLNETYTQCKKNPIVKKSKSSTEESEGVKKTN